MSIPCDYYNSMEKDCREEEGGGREKCKGRCGRPANVCICSALPSEALDTSTHILILQHPHEARHKLATVPLIQKCLRNCHVIVGRRLRRGSSSSILDTICSSTCQLLLLFPDNEAIDINKWVSSSSGMSMAVTQNENIEEKLKWAVSQNENNEDNLKWVESQNENSEEKLKWLMSQTEINEDKLKWVVSQTEINEDKLKWVVSQSEYNEKKLKRVVLVVIDGTWQHAKEMVRASMPFLREIGAVQVCLPYDQNAQGNNKWSCELTLRKEPHGGCLSTIEAVARSLRSLEPTSIAVEVEKRLLSVLHAMVAFQVRNLKPTRSRPKLPRKASFPLLSSSS